MKRQPDLELEPFLNYLNDHKVIYSQDSVKKKKIGATLTGIIWVEHNNIRVYTGAEPSTAIEYYNSI